jgi:S1/P1 Nuclease
MRKCSVVVVLLFLFSASSAYAWGDEGHKVVCEIALSQVKPSTHAAIVELIRADGEFARFSDSCTWPDHPRKRWPWPTSWRGSRGTSCATRPDRCQRSTVSG